jgi:hypothetical protein
MSKRRINVETIKEIHKELPTITISQMDVRSMTEYRKSFVEIKDTSSERALKTYKKILEMSKNES